MPETARLRLRRLRPTDEPALIALDSDVEVMRYIGSRGGTPEQIVERVRQRIDADHGPLGWWLIETLADGAFQGVAALLPMPEGKDVEPHHCPPDPLCRCRGRRPAPLPTMARAACCGAPPPPLPLSPFRDSSCPAV